MKGDESPLQTALRRHATLGVPTLTAAELMGCAAAWDAALAEGVEVARSRGAVLGVSDGDAVLAAMAAGVESDLADTALGAGIAVPDGAGVLGRVHRRVRERVIGDLEAACRDLGERLAAHRDLPTVLEWTEVLAVRDLASRAADMGGPEVRRLVFADVHGAVCPLACRLWNDRREHALAGALFRWLYQEATAVGDERLAEHERRNLQPGR